MKKTVKMLTAIMCAVIIAISGSHVAEIVEARAGLCANCGELTSILQYRTVTTVEGTYHCDNSAHLSTCIVTVYKVSEQRRYYCTSCGVGTDWVETSSYNTEVHSTE